MFPTRVLRMQASRPFAFPAPKENHSGMGFPPRPHYLSASAHSEESPPGVDPSRSGPWSNPDRLPPPFLSHSAVFICPPLTQFHRSVAVGAAIYSSTRKLMTDKTLRLYRNSPEDREH
ncbi:hypothetical protein BO85DRAFT_436542 [Aspergillus piperis CBS 112811]|uniref:Uncharacterized protein n=3 Tax=Aspergillus subgen. Circumdati TaxID=2720871 RepID=A0A8G1R4U3_9EURO|nr:hypothetical protein BO87DRAFT_417296 [Aspergillus neoniger CBS 115656]XP_025517500.1 hypothetical protein BO85DRAFT_436542 [Aspergillus piperis CBS 112811]XP_025536718.1 hypothetical protein BO79DRAFT_155160 [Aspergillus costaricaensis CBS 115574]GAA82463.1 hypothetical protein AKAW_00578 [Aspergillus luchuensis IFO 4308]PYH32623.1 hypothetical protein BO87DRAFT_417296 [Aspergillus neoniger CBS 115656]RAH59578.1 hypothetical protein BO85DRAFT_436542 [Aspergillus piperis CBS 112811]RAK8588